MANQKITLESSRKKYFTMLPNLVDDSDLDVYEFRLLVHYTRVGDCWEGTKTTARICNMSIGAVSKKRRSLALKKWILLEEPNPTNPTDTIKIKVMDKWLENMSVYSPSPHETPPSPHETPPSPHETKNTTIKNNSIKNMYENTGIATDDQIQPLINALKLVSRERYTNARHSKFDDIALTIHGDGATPEQIKRFGEWWEKEACWYKPPTQPALNTIADEWTNFISGKIMKNTSPDKAPTHIQGLF